MTLRYNNFLVFWEWVAWLTKSRWTEAEGWLQKEPIPKEHPNIGNELWEAIKAEATAFVAQDPTSQRRLAILKELDELAT